MPVAPDGPLREGKYSRIERERRFLLAEPPPVSAAIAVRRITDRYLAGTRLRLRRAERLDTGDCEYKLTQKVAAPEPAAAQGLITNLYLTVDEYTLLASLPAAVLTKTRLSVPPLGIDVFAPALDGLVLAEAEFATDAAAQAFVAPPGAVAEVTTDVRFTGGRLVHTSRDELLSHLAEYGMSPTANPPHETAPAPRRAPGPVIGRPPGRDPTT